MYRISVDAGIQALSMIGIHATRNLRGFIEGEIEKNFGLCVHLHERELAVDDFKFGVEVQRLSFY